jgi:hypothetical protein
MTTCLGKPFTAASVVVVIAGMVAAAPTADRHPLAIFAESASAASEAQSCNVYTANVNSIKQSIERDKRAIKSLGFNTDATDFDSLASASNDSRDLMAKTAYDNLIGAALDSIGESVDAALESRSGLPNGFASLNPINVNAVVRRLDDPTGPVASILRQVAATSNKRRKLQFLKQLSEAATKEKAGFEVLFEDDSTTPRSLAAYLKLTEVLSDLAGFKAASNTLRIGNSGANVLVAYADLLFENDALKRLNHLTAYQARALAKLDSTMRAHLESLQTANENLEQCNSALVRRPVQRRPGDPDWAAALVCDQNYNRCQSTCRTPMGLVCGSCFTEWHKCRCAANACD